MTYEEMLVGMLQPCEGASDRSDGFLEHGVALPLELKTVKDPDLGSVDLNLGIKACRASGQLGEYPVKPGEDTLRIPFRAAADRSATVHRDEFVAAVLAAVHGIELEILDDRFRESHDLDVRTDRYIDRAQAAQLVERHLKPVNLGIPEVDAPIDLDHLRGHLAIRRLAARRPLQGPPLCAA